MREQIFVFLGDFTFTSLLDNSQNDKRARTPHSLEQQFLHRCDSTQIMLFVKSSKSILTAMLIQQLLFGLSTLRCNHSFF